jgi:hypothetical protein
MTVFRNRILGTGVGGETWVTTLHTESSTGLGDVGSAFNTFASDIGSGALAALWSTNFHIVQTVTDQLDDVTGRNVAQLAGSVTLAGTAVDKPQSPRACVVVSLKTTTPTRGGHGRMFWPAPTAASIDALGKLTDAASTAFSTAFGAALTDLAFTTVPVIYHRPTIARTTYNKRTGVATVHAASAATTIPITRVAVNSKLGTQRRRTDQTPSVYTQATV